MGLWGTRLVFQVVKKTEKVNLICSIRLSRTFMGKIFFVQVSTSNFQMEIEMEGAILNPTLQPQQRGKQFRSRLPTDFFSKLVQITVVEMIEFELDGK